MATEDYTALCGKILKECTALYVWEDSASTYFSILLDELFSHVTEMTDSTRPLFWLLKSWLEDLNALLFLVQTSLWWLFMGALK